MVDSGTHVCIIIAVVRSGYHVCTGQQTFICNIMDDAMV